MLHIEAAEDDETYLDGVKVTLLKDPFTGTGGAAPLASQGGHRHWIRRLAAELANRRPRMHPTGQSYGVASRPVENEFPEDEPPPAPPAPKPAKATSAASAKKNQTAISPSPTKTHSARKILATMNKFTRSKDWAETFTQGLPNYICQQITTRYVEQSRASGWTPLDVVTAKIVYQDGHEDYKEITVGGKRTNKSMIDIGGTTRPVNSLAIYVVFSSATGRGLNSHSRRRSRARQPPFTISRCPSRHRIGRSSQGDRRCIPSTVARFGWRKPPDRYDASNSKPIKFPRISHSTLIQTAVDYESIRLGTGMFLLPVHAEGIICQRGTSICSKNEIDFRDYHKYSGESTIVYK